jgi:hypothetical protein
VLIGAPVYRASFPGVLGAGAADAPVALRSPVN